MLDFIEKYASLLKMGLVILAIAGAGWLGHHVGVNDTKLSQTTGELGAVTTEYSDYQKLVKDRDDKAAQLTVLQTALDQQQNKEQHDVQNTTQQLLNTLRNPTASVYAPSDCGEAGTYPTVFGTSFGADSTTPSTGLSNTGTAVPVK